MIAGCLIVPLATKVDHYELVLAALFVIAGGIAVLQWLQPPRRALGAPERSHLRLTLSQAFNSLGTVIGPYLGATLMLRGGCSPPRAAHALGLWTPRRCVRSPYGISILHFC